jgi:Histone methylation protein DOT1
VKYGPGFFDHPQCAAGYDYECCLDYPWRFIDEWRAYRKCHNCDEGPTATSAVELPDDDDMRDYVVEGCLVAPNGVRARVRIDNLMRISFDRSKETRGWWVSGHNGDGATQAVYYRFLEPDTSGLPEGGVGRSPHHLRRRALLALLSNVLDVGFATSEQGNGRARQPVRVALRDYRMRLANEKIHLDPILCMFKKELQSHLVYAHENLTPRSVFFRSLASLREASPPSTASLLALIDVAEDISGQSQWGHPRTTDESSSETSSVGGSVRLKPRSLESDGPAKKQRVDSTPLSANQTTPALVTIPREPKRDLMCLTDFKVMLSMIEGITGESIEEVEKSNSVRLQGRCTSHQYGRILPDAMEIVFDTARVSRDDTFVDIGSGIGTLVLQAAYTRGCLSRGIEILQGRHDVALRYADHAARCQDKFPGLKPGRAHFLCGDLRSRDSAKTFSKRRGAGRLVGFCNNFEGLMGARSETNTGPSVEHYVAGQFASWPEGSVLVTVSPLLCLGKPRDAAMTELKKHNMNEGDPTWASFYCVEEFALGPQNEVASWSFNGGCAHMITAFKYTRLAQAGKSESVVRCLNPACPTARSGAAIEAVKYDDSGMPLINACACGYEQRSLRFCPPNRGYCEPVLAALASLP